MSTQISKRRLLGEGALAAGVGVGALALLAPQRASADTPFTGFAFPATGAPKPRTMPDRLADVKNVKDFGALGNGTTDDTLAIQSAVNWTSRADRGVIFFPPGTYKVSAPITFNYDGELSIIFQGVGNLSTLTGNFPGYILDRSNPNTTSGIRVVRDLKISNSNGTGGGIRMMGTVGASIENCHVTSYRGVVLTNGNSWQVFNTKLTSSRAPGSVGIIASNAVSIVNCDIQAYEHGIRHHNIGLQVIGGRIEVCTVGIVLGQDENGNHFQSTAFFIAGTSMEYCETGIHAKGAAAGQITAVSMGTAAPILSGLNLSGCFSTLISGVAMGGPFTVAAFDARGAGGVTFIGCVANNTAVGGKNWLLPENPAKITRIQC